MHKTKRRPNSSLSQKELICQKLSVSVNIIINIAIDGLTNYKRGDTEILPSGSACK